jgi:hypothetical protein
MFYLDYGLRLTIADFIKFPRYHAVIYIVMLNISIYYRIKVG